MERPPSLFFPPIFPIFSSSSSTSLDLECVWEVRQLPFGKSESLDGPPKHMSFPSGRHQWAQMVSFPFLCSSQNIPTSLRRAMLMNKINTWKFWETRAKFATPYMQLVWVKSELFSPFRSWSADPAALSAPVHRPSLVKSQHLAVVVGSGTCRGHWSLPKGNLSDMDLNIQQRKDSGCHLVEKVRFWHGSSTLLLWRGVSWEYTCQKEEYTTLLHIRKAP